MPPERLINGVWIYITISITTDNSITNGTTNEESGLPLPNPSRPVAEGLGGRWGRQGEGEHGGREGCKGARGGKGAAGRSRERDRRVTGRGAKRRKEGEGAEGGRGRERERQGGARRLM